jgi:integral membrane protein
MSDTVAPQAPAILPEAVPGIRGALIRYRIMAYVVGTLLVVLVLVGVPLKYLGGNGTVVMLTGVPHGYLYMVLLVTAYDLGRRVHWPWGRLILIALCGTVPFLSFWAEYSARRDVQARLRAVEEASSHGETLLRGPAAGQGSED